MVPRGQTSCSESMSLALNRRTHPLLIEDSSLQCIRPMAERRIHSQVSPRLQARATRSNVYSVLAVSDVKENIPMMKVLRLPVWSSLCCCHSSSSSLLLASSSVRALSILHQRFGGTTNPRNHHPMMASLDNNDRTAPSKKVVYCVRHGQSVANAWMERSGNEWGCKDYNDFLGNSRDAPLSELGIHQARALTQPFLPDVQLVVVSPMTRCLETYLHSSLVPPETPVIVLPMATERVYSLSEIGRSKSTLLQEFPTTWTWNHVPEQDSWWYTTSSAKEVVDADDNYKEWRPHGNGQVYAVPGEPLANFDQRMNELRHWLLFNRTETCILLITHWGVIRHLSGGLEVANGQVERLELVLHHNSRI